MNIENLVFPAGPWRSEGGIVKSVSHGKWSTVARVEKRGWTERGIADTATLISQAPTLREENAKLVSALQAAGALVNTARNYFPKSIRNSDKFNLELVAAEIGKALAGVQS